MGFVFSLRLYSAENRLKVNSCIYKWDGIGEKPLDLRIIVWHSGKEPTWWCRRLKRLRFDPWVGKIPWRRKRQLTPVSLPGESHGWTEEPGGLQSMGLQRVGHNWSTRSTEPYRKTTPQRRKRLANLKWKLSSGLYWPSLEITSALRVCIWI